MQNARGSSISWTEIKGKYPEDRFIHVLPAEDSVFAHASPQWRLDVTLVKFDPMSSKDVYPIERGKATKNPDGSWTEGRPITVGLTKAALERLCSAADVSILGDRVDDRGDDLFAEFVAVGVLASKSGTIRTQPASKTWNGRLRREVKRREAEKRFDKVLSKGWKVQVPGGPYKSARDCSAEERELVVSDWFTDEWLREREYGPATAESKCQNRARRAILGLAAKYTFEEIRDKTFVVPRWVFEPDMSDPEIKRMVIGEGLLAQRRAFLLPPAQAAGGAALPPAGAAPSGALEPSKVGEVRELPPAPADARAAEEAAEEAEEKFHAADLVEEDPDEALPGDEPEAGPDDDAGPDDVDLIPDRELSFYLAAAIRRYDGPSPGKVRRSWEKASKDEDFATLRIILRHVYAHSGNQA